MPYPHARPCQYCLLLFFFSHFQPCSRYYHGLTSHITAVVAWPLTHIAPRYPKENICSMRMEKGCISNPMLSFSTPSSLFPTCLSVALSLSVCTTALDLLAPGSCYAHNIQDQSSLVIGQRGFRQRKKEAPVTSKDI